MNLMSILPIVMTRVDTLIKKVHNYKESRQNEVRMLNIKHPEADRLARILAQQTGETITEVVIEALREKLLREQGRRTPLELKESLLQIGKRCANLPDHDTRVLDEILGYDAKGLPK